VLRRINALAGTKISAPPVAPPLLVPWAIRLLQNGNGNRGDICYSSKAIFAMGFKMPFGLDRGLEAALSMKDGVNR
jgi:hypothetical protein